MVFVVSIRNGIVRAPVFNRSEIVKARFDRPVRVVYGNMELTLNPYSVYDMDIRCSSISIFETAHEVSISLV